mmetsp:Transcript_41669/g.90025  ORF Transcript_41669/g.90025 Transcript_41669/m.90025 type:complete len:567 (-) Transcript_41669:218-1918(-)|eukprot:CAMPEP_0206471282 /NCGR_PEP_ID=MMETSP0324_2-20121206/31461_1 /ASSEMBLY_ACC=CAM_ASM_000836 /TAXON_ID=2866 /ORGANISM="Crypthecodinium cohnii, Strain Seligo" /LENGTH=566 /DNA_ID=CAMNT_0053945559 /DNA_START=86 /DNA_END=1786 /DNA_ORIENTATION=+
MVETLLSKCSSVLPWGPFLLAMLGRAVIGFYLSLVVEGFVVNRAPSHWRNSAFYAALAYVGQSVLRSIVSNFFAGPTPDRNVTVESGSFLNGDVAWVAGAMRGWRESMEDAHIATMLDDDLFGRTALCAVFDGHGGKEVSALASKLLPNLVHSWGRRAIKGGGKQQKGDKVDLQACLEETIPAVDARLRRGIGGLGCLLPIGVHPFSTTGSTACVVAIDFVTREVICSNIGDSRAMIIRNGRAMALSDDHKPENPLERRRIEEAGGAVVKAGPCFRIDNNLNLSRAFGDFHLKANPDKPPERQKVIAVPDSKRMSFASAVTPELLVIACDGLFEKRSNQEVANLIWPRWRSGTPLQEVIVETLQACCAKAMFGRPIEEGTDNETLIIVQLPPASRPTMPATTTTTRNTASAAPAASPSSPKSGKNKASASPKKSSSSSSSPAAKGAANHHQQHQHQQQQQQQASPTNAATSSATAAAAAFGEAARSDGAGGTSAAAAADDAEELTQNCRVQIVGLTSDLGRLLNGLEGIVEGTASGSEGRLAVRLEQSGDLKSLKASNLKVIGGDA